MRRRAPSLSAAPIMTALAPSYPMLVAAREAQVLTRLAVADAADFTLDARRSSLREAIKRWAAGRFVRFVDKHLVHPVLRAPSPSAMDAELEARVPRVLALLRTASSTVSLGGRVPSLTPSAEWESILDDLSARDLEHLDGVALAQLRVALSANALATREIFGALADPSTVADEDALLRGVEVMVRGLIPLFVLLAWTHEHEGVRADVLEALAARVTREADDLTIHLTHAIREDAS